MINSLYPKYFTSKLNLIFLKLILFIIFIFFSTIFAQTPNDYWWYSTSENLLYNPGGFYTNSSWASIDNSQWGVVNGKTIPSNLNSIYVSLKHKSRKYQKINLAKEENITKAMKLGHSVKVKISERVSRSACFAEQNFTSSTWRTVQKTVNVVASYSKKELESYLCLTNAPMQVYVQQTCNKTCPKTCTRRVQKTCNNRTCHWNLWERCTGGDFDCSYTESYDCSYQCNYNCSYYNTVPNPNACADLEDKSIYKSTIVSKTFSYSANYDSSKPCLKYGKKIYSFGTEITNDCTSFRPNGSNTIGTCNSNSFISHIYKAEVEDPSVCLEPILPTNNEIISNYIYLEPESEFINPLTKDYYRYYNMIKVYDKSNQLITTQIVKPTQIEANGI